MDYKIILITKRSISVEMQNNSPYYNNMEIDVYIDDVCKKSKVRKNVFSIFNLEPNKEYKIRINNIEKTFKTKEEALMLNVLDFNACNKGLRDSTLAFSACIAASVKNTTILVPKGIYLLKPIFLKSDITIYLEEGALILGDTNRENYPVLPAIVKGKNMEYNLGTWEGEEVECFASLITGLNVSNVEIIGEGRIDAQSKKGDWYNNHRVKRTAWRPFLVYFNRCTNMVMQGLTLENSPSWNVHPYFSNNLDFIDLTLLNPKDMPTTDGLDPDCCSDVRIIGVYFSVGDDCIAIKSGQIDLAKKYLTPSKNILIENCYMEHGHGGVVFGSESSAGIYNVKVNKCIFYKTDRGLRIKTRRGRGRYGIIDNVDFDNIIMDEVPTPLVVNMFYNMGPVGGHEEYAWTKEKLPVDERTPYIGSFHFKNMICTNISLSAGIFLGLPEETIKEITLENIKFSYNLDAVADYPVMVEHKEKVLRQGLYFYNVDQVNIKNVSFENQLTDEIIDINVKNINII